MLYRAVHSQKRWRRVALSALAIALAGLSAAGAEEFRKLSDAQIKRLVTGRVLTDEAHYRDQFLAGGKYEGVSMGKSFSGTWEVSGGELCFTRTAGQRPDCNEIWQSRTDAKHIELRKSWQTEGTSAVVSAE